MIRAKRTYSLEDRLNAFFAAARDKLRPEPIVAPLVQQYPELENLRKVFRDLQKPLEMSRRDGAFLNVWKAAGLKRDEVRNSAALATLLDHRQLGQDGRLLLGAFLDRLRRAGKASVPNEMQVGEPYTVGTEICPLGDATNRVDLSIEGTSFFLYIEVKIDAGEGDRQLDRYRAVASNRALLVGKRPFFIFLSPRPPKVPRDDVVHATWKDLASAARAVSRRKTGLNASLLRQFSEHSKGFGG